MKKVKLTATLPNGEAVTRTTHRTYTNVIAASTFDGDWVVLGWAGSPAFAEKFLNAKLAFEATLSPILNDAEVADCTARRYSTFTIVEVNN